jgi:hypothetical protein
VRQSVVSCPMQKGRRASATLADRAACRPPLHQAWRERSEIGHPQIPLEQMDNLSERHGRMEWLNGHDPPSQVEQTPRSAATPSRTFRTRTPEDPDRNLALVAAIGRAPFGAPPST